MTFIVATLLGALAILVAVTASLLVQRRALRESVEQFRLSPIRRPSSYGPTGRTRPSTTSMASVCS